MSVGLLPVQGQVAGAPCVLGVVKRDEGEEVGKGWERWGTNRLPRCLLQPQPAKHGAAVPCIVTYRRDGNPGGKADG